MGIMGKDISSALDFRYAAKKFDASRKISAENLNVILESMRLAPSSLGLQPWKFVVVENPEKKKRLTPLSYHQAQIETASHLVVIASLTRVSEAHVDHYLEVTAAIRGQKLEELQDYRKMIMGYVSQMDETQTTAWAAKQAYLAFGFGMLTAAALKIDACPMEGIVGSAYDQALSIPEPYHTQAVLALGYRDPSDKLQTAVKSRFSADQVIRFV